MDLEHALLAGGGSGGHVFPALAVAEELARRGWRVSWLGRVEGMERELARQAGLPYHGLPSRAVVGRSLRQGAAALASLGVSALRARTLIRRLDVGVVLGTGGYASAPGVLGAALARRPAVLLEPNAVSGTANRWLSRWATAAAVAVLPGARDLRCPIRATGIPVRKEFLRERRPPAGEGPLQLLVLGGSQGARQLNRLLPPALARLGPALGALRVVHQVGSALLEEARQAYQEHPLEHVKLSVVPFLDDMAGTMQAAHLVVSRAGAVTLAEICAAGRAALLLPLTLAGSHQLANAQRLVAIGGARTVSDPEVAPQDLAELLGELLSDRARLAQMGRANRRLCKPDAAAEIADLMEEVAGAD